jgi:hypothetical protein
MMGRWAMVRTSDNVVVNVIEWDGVTPYTSPAGIVLIDGTGKDVGPEYMYDPGTGTFSPPPEPPPEP